MTTLATLYGNLAGVEFRTLYSNGRADGCLVGMPNILKTPYGNLVPQYESEDMGRRPVKPLYFFRNGSIKSIALQTQSPVRTPAGMVPAELVTFFESGSIKRVFPLDGKLTGFWTARNEYALAEPLRIDTPAGRITAKLIGLQFYASGALKSITLWPGQQVTVVTPIGKITVRTGMAFYENGAIRSLEPATPVKVQTPAGLLTAFDNEPNGIHGDVNSLKFGSDGSIEGLSTTQEELKVIDLAGKEHLFAPGMKNRLCGGEGQTIVPLRIGFTEERIILNGTPATSFILGQCRIRVTPFSRETGNRPYSCSG